MAYQITQTLTSAPTPAPNRNTDTPSEFSDNVDAQLSWQRTNTSENQTLITQQNALSTAVEGYSTAAQAAQTGAEAAETATIALAGATAWDSGTTYALNDPVIGSNQATYRSAQNTNLNHNPVTDDGTWWTRVTGTDFLTDDLDCNGKTFQGSSYDQIADASLGTGTHTFDYSSGDGQQITATGDITLGVSNFVSGKICSFIADCVNFGDHTISIPAAWLMASGTAPTWTSGGTDRIEIYKDKDDVYTLTVKAQALAVA